MSEVDERAVGTAQLTYSDKGPWTRFRRFLILGAEGGTHYVGAEEHAIAAALATRECVKQDGVRAVREAVEVSDGGRALKNDPAIATLAIAAASEDIPTRAAALAAVPKVCRIPTHLYQFVEFSKGLRGWGPAYVKAVQRWFTTKDAGALAYELCKYQQRGGWSALDLLRKAHPKPPSAEHAAVFRWAAAGMDSFDERVVTRRSQPGREVVYGGVERKYLPNIVSGMVLAHAATEAAEWARLVREYELTREMLPTEALKEKLVWEALLEEMPPHALLRNLGNLSKCGLLTAGSAAETLVAERLADAEALRRRRVHPFAIFLAARVYSSGRGVLGKGEWTVAPKVLDALDAAFVPAFRSVETTGKRILLAVDVSGSMSQAISHVSNGKVNQFPITCAEAAAAMALVTHKTEPNARVVAFNTQVVAVSAPLEDIRGACAVFGAIGGGTDCASPALWMPKQKEDYDALVLYSDNESWAGTRSVASALAEYRDERNPELRASCVSTAATGTKLTEPKDTRSLDVVGFDADVPAVLAEFIAGRV